MGLPKQWDSACRLWHQTPTEPGRDNSADLSETV